MNLAGFAVGARFVRAGRPQLAVILYLVMVAFCLAWIFLQPDRTMTIGTYADWQRGAAPAGSTDPFFMKFVVGLIVGYSAGLWLVFRSISRDGARLTITSSVQ